MSGWTKSQKHIYQLSIMAHIRPKMKELLIYQLYFFLLNSEKLDEIIFLYVYVCSLYFLISVCVPWDVGMLGYLKLKVGKAHQLACVQTLLLITSPARLPRQFTSAWLTPRLQSTFDLPRSLIGNCQSLPSPQRVLTDEEPLYLLYLLKTAARVK